MKVGDCHLIDQNKLSKGGKYQKEFDRIKELLLYMFIDLLILFAQLKYQSCMSNEINIFLWKINVLNTSKNFSQQNLLRKQLNQNDRLMV
ncbi:hypothetical protein TTHERM_00053870 (macronuclear) [Tetrahymena thermophila SB210]|uniref:Uncharacterized protein n=1 Tax=Tetrahymena thermophila (strain SB210) TaxID=312017 RepID=I7MH69_TETTS|nr:hypothetical protein TTHERM_00053870 [Tetrahymena thermophila SB210]EAR87271.1 hypothetical protein TTHERM_00053870 [Tetrahymena thermophila SB210]|eukprot:XP_001007516.1 hypothetical protein TTHERM_00053870 [Tetrahymena thermophila SB210]